MKPAQMNYKDLIEVLVSENQILSSLFEGNEKYKPLLQELMKYKYNVDDFSHFPKQKDLIKTLNLTREKFMDLLHELHGDFKTKLFNPGAYKISSTEAWLYARFKGGYWPVGVAGLEVIPRVGERFIAEFIRAELGGMFFYVEKVHHRFTNGMHRINIYLKGHLIEDKEDDPYFDDF